MSPSASLRSSERGLKSTFDLYRYAELFVAPFVGAWIEITGLGLMTAEERVAPFVGAWIEISLLYSKKVPKSSLRSSERGLKFDRRFEYAVSIQGRSVRRSVD